MNMKNYICVLLYILSGLFEISKSQYIMMNNNMLKKSNQCDPNNTLVEQFFNIIFTEFRHTPPVCVCVQMCMGRPTYCYPNSCLKRPSMTKEETTASTHAVNEIYYDSRNQAKSVMFLVENDLIDNMFEEPTTNSNSETRQKLSNELILRPNPFKELVFKYRKIPKLEMRYNLREKVKNTRSEKIKRDKLGVSKTRWPTKKHLLQGRQLLNSIRNFKKDDDFQKTFFASTFPELASATANHKLNNNKFLSKRDDNSVKVDSLYVYKTDANFSIENLIDDLIISSFDDKNNLKANETSITTDILAHKNKSETNTNDENATVNIVLMNTINETTNMSKYRDDLNSPKLNTTYLQEIIAMSERIDENNNNTVEFVKRMTGLSDLENETSHLFNNNSSLDIITTKLDHKQDYKQTVSSDTTNMTTTTSKTDEENASATKKRNSLVLKKILKQKSKQRIIRKLDRKVN